MGLNELYVHGFKVFSSTVPKYGFKQSTCDAHYFLESPSRLLLIHVLDILISGNVKFGSACVKQILQSSLKVQARPMYVLEEGVNKTYLNKQINPLKTQSLLNLK